MDQCIIVSRNHIKCVSQKPTTKKDNCNIQKCETVGYGKICDFTL